MKKTITVVTGGHGGMGKAICKELGKTSVIVLAGRNLAKMEAAKAELDELGVESYLCKYTSRTAHRCRHWQTMLHRSVT